MNNSHSIQEDYVLTDVDYKELCALVYHHTGISLTEEKRKLAYSRFSKRLKALKLNSFAEYCDLLKTNAGLELDHFTNAITTNLTSFFREQHHFDRLRNEIVPQLLKKTNRKIRIWSAGCSTGEEPYSIAMSLMSHMSRLKSWDVKILATDLDSQVIQTASRGVYAPNRVDGIDAETKQRCFSPVTELGQRQYKVNADLRALITFKRLNLMNKDWPMRGPFDVIFCRNVVIYFNKETQIKLFKKFAELQNKDDHLIVGHSESLKGIAEQYRHVGRTSYVRV